MRAPTVTSGRIAQVSHQAASRTTRARAMLETRTRATVVNSKPYLRCWAFPLRRTTIETAKCPKTNAAPSAKAPAAQPMGRTATRAPLRAMKGPRTARYTRIATTDDIADDARLKASFGGDCRRIAPRASASPRKQQMTRTGGAAITNPSSSGTSLSTRR